MIQRGDLEHHLRAMRRCYRRCRDALVGALSETLALSIGGAAAGLRSRGRLRAPTSTRSPPRPACPQPHQCCLQPAPTVRHVSVPACGSTTTLQVV